MSETISLWEEHLFWLEMLQDHAYFVRDHLSPSEIQFVTAAQQYIHLFSQLISELKTIVDSAQAADPSMIGLARKVWPVARGYLDFEGQLQSLRIDNRINLNLSPTYLNGTISENAEYIRILNQLTMGKEPDRLPAAELMDVWLEDQLGHAVLLKNMLDPIEVFANRQADAYIGKFQVYIVQNKHIKGFLRFKEPGFPRQQEFIYEVGMSMVEMNQWIYAMVKKFREHTLLTKTTIRFLEHHFPETCYFLTKMSFYEPRLKPYVNDCSLIKTKDLK